MSLELSGGLTRQRDGLYLPMTTLHQVKVLLVHSAPRHNLGACRLPSKQDCIKEAASVVSFFGSNPVQKKF